MAKEDIPKTAIITSFGLSEFLWMPFSLKNSAQAFQRLMDGVLCSLSFVFVYLDDILVASPTLAEHVRIVLDRLSFAGLAINVEKCKFGASSVNFLGHSVSSEGISSLAKKIEAITEMQQPVTKVEMQIFLGCINFYHRFIPLAPLHALSSLVKSANAPLTWTPDVSKSFLAAEAALSAFVLLVHPNPDPVTPSPSPRMHQMSQLGSPLARLSGLSPRTLFKKVIRGREEV